MPSRSKRETTSRQPINGADLQEIFPVEGPDVAGPEAIEMAILVPPALITPDEDQPRKIFDQEELLSLASQIKEARKNNQGVGGTGILQPLLCRYGPIKYSGEQTYIIIAGERRYRASLLVKLPLVPIIVVDINAQAASEAALIENIQRVDLAPTELAKAIQKYMENHKLSIRQMAAVLGKNRTWVTNRVGLLSRGKDVIAMVEQRNDTLIAASYIDQVKDTAVRKQIIEAALEGESFVRLRERVQQQLEVEGQKMVDDDDNKTSSSRESGSSVVPSVDVNQQLQNALRNVEKALDAVNGIAHSESAVERVRSQADGTAWKIQEAVGKLRAAMKAKRK